MSPLPKETIEELQEILTEEGGVNVSFDEATQIANFYVSYFDILAQIRHRELIADTTASRKEVISEPSIKN